MMFFGLTFQRQSACCQRPMFLSGDGLMDDNVKFLCHCSCYNAGIFPDLVRCPQESCNVQLLLSRTIALNHYRGRMCFLRGVPKSTPKRHLPTPPTSSLRSQTEDTGDGELVEEGVLECS